MATVFVTLTLTFAIWLTQSLRLIELIVDGGAPLRLFATLILLTLPSFLAIVMPIGLVAAILFTYNRLTTDSELVVMRAAGLSPLALAKPAVLLGVVVMMIGYALNLYVAPAANRELIQLRTLVQTEYSTVFLREGVFNDVSDGLTVYVRERAGDGELNGILIHDTRGADTAVTVTAERGVLLNAEAGARVIVYNGSRQEVDERTGKLSELYFDRYAIDLQIFKPEFAPRAPEPRERDIGELLRPHDGDDPIPRGELIAELHQRLSAPILAVSFAMIGLASLLSGEFNRRGQARRIVAAILFVILLQSAELGLSNLVAKSTAAVPIMYVVTIAPIFVSIWVLTRWQGGRRPAPRPTVRGQVAS